MPIQKPTVKFKTYKQAARVGGKIYGVADLSDPQIASVTMQEVIDYAKLHNYSADTLEAVLSQVISGVADLVARDGRPRNLSDLLKFEPVIKGTFSNMEQAVSSNQKIVIRPRLLKEIRVNIASDAFAWQNQNDTLAPILRSVAPASPSYSSINLSSVRAALAETNGFGFTLSGTRLAPSGWDQSCKFEVAIRPHSGAIAPEIRFDHTTGGLGCICHLDSDEATDNTVALSWTSYLDPDEQEGALVRNAWYDNDGTPTDLGVTYIPGPGDILIFRLTRTVGSGDTFTVEKSYEL